MRAFLLIAAVTIPTCAQVPPGWTKKHIFAEIPVEVTIDIQTRHGGHASARVSFDAGQKTQGAGLRQDIQADDYRGKRVRWSAWIKTEGIEGSAFMTIAAIGGKIRTEARTFAAATQDWKRYDTVIDVPQDAIHIALAYFLDGKRGRTWVDDMSFEVVDAAVPFTGDSGPSPDTEKDPTWVARTRVHHDELPKAPINLDFEH
jgi:hypothetical protein